MKEFTIDIGNRVICDFCDTDYTDRNDLGGVLFESKAVCPECVPGLLESCAKYNEERFIRDRAGDGESFRDFVLRIRNGNNLISVSGSESEVDGMAAYFNKRFGD